MNKKNIFWLIIGIIVILALFLINELLNGNWVKNESSETTTNETKEEYIYVYIYGEVKRSGVYSVPSTWTLVQLLNMVDTTDDADISNLDLAKTLESGATYYVGKIENGTTSVVPSTLININTATQTELETLPGIGTVRASKIIAYREKQLFKSISDIKNVEGIGDEIFEKIKGLITV